MDAADKKGQKTTRNLLFILFCVIALNSSATEFKFLQRGDLDFVSYKPTGYNSGAVFTLRTDDTQRVYAKSVYRTSPNGHSLYVSYLANSILQLVVPNHSPRILPFFAREELMIAAFEMPEFLGEWPGFTKSYVLVNLALDLMDIGDRKASNLGIGLVNGSFDAVMVDLDMFYFFKENWLFNIDPEYCYKFKGKFKSALNHISSFSDEEMRKVFYGAAADLEEAFSSPVGERYRAKNKFDELDDIWSKVLVRKHQMKWVSEHLDAVCDVVESESFSIEEWLRYFIGAENKRFTEGLNRITHEALSDDKYGFFLRAAKARSNVEVIKLLSSNTSQESSGATLTLRSNEL